MNNQYQIYILIIRVNRLNILVNRICFENLLILKDLKPFRFYLRNLIRIVYFKKRHRTALTNLVKLIQK